jgi:hypothetical protein
MGLGGQCASERPRVDSEYGHEGVMADLAKIQFQ